MSDNLPTEAIHEQLGARFCIPNETWTDIFKPLSRRTLLQHISPVSFRFKEICERNVKSVHLITEAGRFFGQLECGNFEAKKHLEDLAGNNCPLADQFQLKFGHIWIKEGNKAILPHCLDLFRGLEIKIDLQSNGQNASIEECFSLLEGTRPVEINFCRDIIAGFTIRPFWRHPTILNASSLWFSLLTEFTVHSVNVCAVFDWLHHVKPVEVEEEEGDGDDASSLVQQQPQKRSLTLFKRSDPLAIEWLLKRCIQEFQEAKGPEDRRQFVFNFVHASASFSHASPSTGEVLVLAPKNGGEEHCLRRCLAQEEGEKKPRPACKFYEWQGSLWMQEIGRVTM